VIGIDQMDAHHVALLGMFAHTVDTREGLRLPGNCESLPGVALFQSEGWQQRAADRLLVLTLFDRSRA
jgi:hypothetical protein